MEFLFWVGIIWFGFSVYGNYKEKQEQEALAELLDVIAKERRDNIFKSKVSNDKIEGDAFNWDTFKIDI